MGNLGTVNINKFFIAQVAPGENQYLKNAKWQDAHGDRVRIRIPGKHPSSGEVKNENLPWAIVLKSTSHGNLNGGSCGLWGGEWVMACYLDESEQIPAIVHVFGNNLTQFDIRESKNGTTEFKRVDRFNSGLTPGGHQIIGDSTKPKGPAQPTKEEVKDATKNPESKSRQIGEVYTNQFGTYEVVDKKVGTELNDDGTPRTVDIVKKLR